MCVKNAAAIKRYEPLRIKSSWSAGCGSRGPATEGGGWCPSVAASPSGGKSWETACLVFWCYRDVPGTDVPDERPWMICRLELLRKIHEELRGTAAAWTTQLRANARGTQRLWFLEKRKWRTPLIRNLQAQAQKRYIYKKDLRGPWNL